LEGFLIKIGKLRWLERPFLIIGGFLIAVPELSTTIVGVLISLAVILSSILRRKLFQHSLKSSSIDDFHQE
jgi:UPF0716 family protein affecting phage T7 exclusion